MDRSMSDGGLIYGVGRREARVIAVDDDDESFREACWRRWSPFLQRTAPRSGSWISRLNTRPVPGPALSTLRSRPRLVEALRLAGPTAAEDLVASHGARAYQLAIGITGNQADAEEVVQDALWTVVRKIDTFTGDSAFCSWLYRIVANAAYDKLRGRRGRPDDCSMDELSAMVGEHGGSVLDWSSRVQDSALDTDLRIVLTAAIEALPEEYRTVVVLRDVEGLPTQEIAQITGLSVANVKVRAHRARLVLRKRLWAYLSGAPTGSRRDGMPGGGFVVDRARSKTGGRSHINDAGRLSGVVERVRTGEKVRFHGLETLNRAVASLLSTTAEGS